MIKYQGTHHYVLNSLGSRIVAGELPAFTVVNLNTLEEEYQVSRTVIREVVRVLESHGMLVSRRRVGITVQPKAKWEVLDGSVIQWRLEGPDCEQQIVELMELRLAIEPAAARFAALRATEDERLRLTELAAVLDDLGRQMKTNTKEFLDADIAFHSALITSCRSPLLMCMVDPIVEALAGRLVHDVLSGIPQADTLEGHVAVAEAVAKGDAAAASAASSALLDVIAEQIDAGVLVAA